MDAQSKDKEHIINNIYSEPLFPISQIGSVDSTQTQLTQTQDGAYGAKQRGGDWRSRRSDSEDDEGTEDSGTQDFRLESMVVRASRMTEEYCTTGCNLLDTALHGGIPTFGITELYGEAGTGKTQLCLQLAVCAQLSKDYGGLDSGVYYICTEDKLPSQRLAELVHHFKGKFTTDLPDAPMNNIFIEHVTEAETLMQCISIKLAHLAARRSSDKRIKLIIIDSVAAIFRSEFDNLSQRTFELRRLAQSLHEYMYDHKASIVVCNQVTASPTLEGNVASLGMVWENMITTRIRMDKSGNSHRSLFVSFSPHIPSVVVPFQISAEGLKATPAK